jgi:hypothetical protein
MTADMLRTTPPAPRVARAVAAAERLGLGRLERIALGAWFASRLGVLVLSWTAAWVTRPQGQYEPIAWLSEWVHWDWLRYLTIAEYGYTSGVGPGSDANLVAFFPGFPLLLRATEVIVRNWTVAGLLVSAIAGAFAVVALARLTAAAWDGGAAVGANDGETGTDAAPAVRNAVLFLVCAPAAVFLAAGYTESLFLAFALFGWWYALRGQWARAGVLVALASLVRVNGLFVLAAVVVRFLLTHRRRPADARWSRAPWLALPLLPVFGYMAYLDNITGDWFAWKHAEDRGWYRSLTNPFDTVRHTWTAAFGREFQAAEAWPFQLELVSMVVGLALICWLAARRAWPELVYVTLSVASLATSFWYESVPRDMLLWWPLWIGLACWAARRPSVRVVYLCVVTPMMVGLAFLFLSGQWSG